MERSECMDDVPVAPHGPRRVVPRLRWREPGPLFVELRSRLVSNGPSMSSVGDASRSFAPDFPTRITSVACSARVDGVPQTAFREALLSSLSAADERALARRP